MIITKIQENVIVTHDVQILLENGEVKYYTRHDDGDWTYDVSYDIMGETYSADDDLAKELEKLYQEELNAAAKSENN
jgi:hypothetical protein